jgi:DNA-binding MarR family transcriptional regulator
MTNVLIQPAEEAGCMEEIDLNPTDEAIIAMLREGRCSPAYIAKEQEYSRQNVTNRLGRLVEHGYVQKVHAGLYELNQDPKDE